MIGPLGMNRSGTAWQMTSWLVTLTKRKLQMELATTKIPKYPKCRLWDYTHPIVPEVFWLILSCKFPGWSFEWHVVIRGCRVLECKGFEARDDPLVGRSDQWISSGRSQLRWSFYHCDFLRKRQLLAGEDEKKCLAMQVAFVIWTGVLIVQFIICYDLLCFLIIRGVFENS